MQGLVWVCLAALLATAPGAVAGSELLPLPPAADTAPPSIMAAPDNGLPAIIICVLHECV